MSEQAEKDEKIEESKGIFREWVLPFLLEFAVLSLILRFIAYPTYVPTGSMIPTIAEGSVLVTTRVYSPETKLRRGDIVSFYSDEFQKALIKRLVGLPGETVELLEDGSILIDGEALEEPYVINQSEGETGVFEVPADCFFFLGDNRTGSEDARYWQQPYIHKDKILSKGVFTLWPVQNFGTLK